MSQQPSRSRPQQEERNQPPPYSDFIQGKGPQYFIEACVCVCVCDITYVRSRRWSFARCPLKTGTLERCEELHATGRMRTILPAMRSEDIVILGGDLS